MQWQLSHQEVIFNPKVHGNMPNDGFVFSSEELKRIKHEAFAQQPLLKMGSDRILKKIFASGLCTGLSAWTLLSFLDRAPQGDMIFNAAVLQARVLLPQVWQSCLLDYGEKMEEMIKRIKISWLSDQWQQYGVLFMIPKMHNLSEIVYAHTIVPYKIIEKNNIIQIYVYDSNSPLNCCRYVVLDLADQSWKYDQFNQKKWFLSYQGISCLMTNFLSSE